MPFMINGDWKPKEENKKDKGRCISRPIKIYKEKRGKRFVTIISNLKESPEEIKSLAMKLKKACASGGATKDRSIEIQGDKADLVKRELGKRDIKFS